MNQRSNSGRYKDYTQKRKEEEAVILRESEERRSQLEGLRERRKQREQQLFEISTGIPIPSAALAMPSAYDITTTGTIRRRIGTAEEREKKEEEEKVGEKDLFTTTTISTSSVSNEKGDQEMNDVKMVEAVPEKEKEAEPKGRKAEKDKRAARRERRKSTKKSTRLSWGLTKPAAPLRYLIG